MLISASVFLGIRALSFLLSPFPAAQTAMAAAAIAIFTFLLIKNPLSAWVMLVSEIFLGGNGHFFEFTGIALRTWFISLFLLFWLVRAAKKNDFCALKNINKFLRLPIIAIGISVIIGIFLGILNHHGVRAVVQDAIPFIFLAIVFPAREFNAENTKKLALDKLIPSYIFGSALFSLLTLFLFSSGISVIQSPYYKWFRDVLGGKITDVGNNFFRIVAPEHLILPVILIFLSSRIIKNPKSKNDWLLFAAGSIPFMLNLSRTYILAYAIGIAFLSSKKYIVRYLAVSLASLIIMFGLFSGIHLIASRGADFGFDLFASRMGGVVNPDSERSSATRKLLLRPILEQIKKHPILGSGLGGKVTFIDPATHKSVTTPHFDWGYLEIWTELGLLGFVSYIFLIIYLLLHTAGAARASVVSLAFMNTTTPIFFHVFGVIFLAFFIVESTYVLEGRGASRFHTPKLSS